MRDGILGEILEACFWRGLGVAEWSGWGEENDGCHFSQECWRCGLGEISGGVLGGGLGLTGRRGNGLVERGGREAVENFRAREISST